MGKPRVCVMSHGGDVDDRNIAVLRQCLKSWDSNSEERWRSAVVITVTTWQTTAWSLFQEGGSTMIDWFMLLALVCLTGFYHMRHQKELRNN